jgi:EAL domain-containing protein (putative c-di-GMP-specific phosphodiesterase class I)/GGDEF domain-containing protein
MGSHRVQAAGFLRVPEGDTVDAGRAVDPLTGLPGPSALADVLARSGRGHALLLLDLDGFQAHNLTEGFASGDRLLRSAAAALLAAAGDAPVLRLSADEFALVVPCPTPDAVLAVADPALAALAALPQPVSACCGAVAVVEDEPGTVAVRRTVVHAGLALQAARRAGPGAVAALPQDGAALGSAEQDDLEVRTALRLGDYELHFQPLVVPATALPVGIEALIRWRRESVEMTGPGVFLPQVRRAGLAAEFGAGVIVDALARWTGGLREAVLTASDGATPAPLLTVNVDVEQADQDGFDDLVLHLLERAAVPAGELVIEVAESVLAEPAAVERLRRLRGAGVHVAIDDFGAGPVVLSEVRELPVDIIKVDQVLVGRLDPVTPDMGLIEDLHRLAGLLGLLLAVEAVETPALAQRVAGLGVPLAQGYHYARPMPPEELVAWLGTGVVPGAATPGRGGRGVAAPDG